MKTLEEMKSMSVQDLKSELLVLRKEQFNLRMKRASGALEKTHVFSAVRKAVAQAKTLITQKAGNKDGN